MGQQATQLVPHQQEEARSAVERIAAFAAARVQQLKPRFDRPRCIRELLPEVSESRRNARPRREVPMSEQAARKREALKEPVLPHQPGQAAFRAILSEDIQWKPFAAFPPAPFRPMMTPLSFRSRQAVKRAARSSVRIRVRMPMIDSSMVQLSSAQPSHTMPLRTSQPASREPGRKRACVYIGQRES